MSSDPSDGEGPHHDPALGPLPPSPPPGFEDNFPEYDAVPANLGPLIPAFIPIKRAEDQEPSHQAAHRDDPAEFLFTANRNFGLATSERAKRKNVKFNVRDLFCSSE